MMIDFLGEPYDIELDDISKKSKILIEILVFWGDLFNG